MDPVSSEMRSRLRTNRHGRLTRDQYKDMIMEPVVALLLLLTPAIMFLGPRVSLRGWLFVGVVTLVLLLGPVLLRAFRYAHAPVHFTRLYAGNRPVERLLFWQALILYTEKGKAVRFKKRLAPGLPLRSERSYLVYYLKDARQNVLLSLAPADHPEAGEWQPSDDFDRSGRRS